MSVASIFTVIHVLFMLGIIVLCLVAAMPTRGWMAVAEKVRRFMARGMRQRLEAAFSKQSQPFTPDENYMPYGVGLAFDHRRGLVFLAAPDKAALRCAIQPQAQLGAHRMVVEQKDGFHHYFIEIDQADSQRPAWRLPCQTADLAARIDQRLQGALG